MRLRAGRLVVLVTHPRLQTSLAAAPTTWLSTTVNAPSVAASTKGVWEALTLAGVVRDESRAKGLPAVVGTSIRVALPNGQSRDEGSTRIPPAPNKPIGANADEGSLRNTVDAAATKAGVDVTSTEVTRPLDYTVSVVTTAPSSDFVRQHQMTLFHQIAGDLIDDDHGASTDGVYLEVRASDGTLLMTAAYSTLVSQGVGWIRPDLKDCGNFC